MTYFPPARMRFSPPNNPHVRWLGHVGRVSHKDDHRHIVPPQELKEGLHRVDLEPIEDEDGSFVEGSQRFTEPGPSPFYFGDENLTDPLPKNLIVDK